MRHLEIYVHVEQVVGGPHETTVAGGGWNRHGYAEAPLQFGPAVSNNHV